MAIIEGPISGNQVEVTADRAMRVTMFPNRGGQGYTTSGQTGAMAAALAANGVIFAMAFDKSAGKIAYVTRVYMDWAVSTAFTVPSVAGRGLAVQRSQGSLPYTGGTTIAVASKKRSDNSSSEFDQAGGGDIRIATTATLTAPAPVHIFEATNLCFLSTAGEGLATSILHKEFTFDTPQSTPPEFRPGEHLIIRNPAAMDAAGVWNLNVQVDWIEVVPSQTPVVV